jgi:hypothetical protein
MALKSLRITKKELQTYYTPKVSDYELMVNSINSNMGYGQIIQTYNSTETGVEVTNTYYHVYSDSYGGPIVIDKTSGAQSSIADAGPTFWGVGSNIGIDFLNGVSGISGLRKLKYCDGCSDGNGLDKPVVDNFSKRFRKVEELVLGNNLLEGFLFYDLTLPKYSNVFPAIKKDDGVNITYQFKNVNTGADLTPNDVSLITGEPVSSIESSVDTAPIIKPQEGANTVITSCCDESIFYVISGQYTIGNILYTENGGQIQSYCWFVESLTKELPTLGDGITFSSGGRSCQACVKLNPCPAVCETIELSYSIDPSTACLGLTSTYQIDWSTGILYNDGDCGNSSPSDGYYGDGKFVYSWDGSSFSEYGRCPTSETSSAVNSCCPGEKGIIEGVYPIGTVLYTKDTDPATCYVVIGNNSDEPTLFYKFNVYEGADCRQCTGIYSGFCKKG